MKATLARLGRVAGALLSLLLRLVLVSLVLLVVALEWALPRLGRRLQPWGARARRRLRREWRTVRLAPLRSLVAAAVLGLVAVNGGVRWSGGDPSWVSARRLPDKVRALAALGWHHVGHPDHPDVEASLRAAARAHGVPLAWVRAVAVTESGLRPHVISHAGAMGLMQLMPATAAAMEVDDPFDPRDNALGGARYLARLRRRYGDDLERVAAAYHAGPSAVPERGRMRVGPTTRRYVRAIARRVARARRPKS